MGFSSGKNHRIRGTVGGDFTGRKITVDAAAHVHGSLGGEEVIIYGEVVGTIKAHVIHLMKTAHVAGELLYDSLTVDPGAQVEARCVPSQRLAV